jgi:hypothetical protein
LARGCSVDRTLTVVRRTPDRIHRVLVFRRHTTGMKPIRRFLADQSTVAVIEYGLIAVVIAFVLIGAVNEAQH